MNGYNFDFNNPFASSFFESPEQRQHKRDTLKKRFSRVFLALFIYTIISQFLSTAIYIAAGFILTPEQYQVLYDSTLASLILSCVVQYLVAFPIFFLIIRGVDKAQEREQRKMTVTEFIPMLFISEILMFAGNMIGTFLNNFIGTFIGGVPENNISNIIMEIPITAIFLFMVIIGPIVEELIFRKLMIDRLSIYGDHIAIIFTSIAFGLIHGNLYQFFYATFLGVLLGYVYTSTGKVRYSALIHMIINFLGSIVPLFISDYLDRFSIALENGELSNPDTLLAHLPDALVYVLYLSFQMSLVIGGAVVLAYYIKKRKLRVSKDKEVNLTDAEILKSGTVNVGVILFLIISFVLSTLSLFIQ